MLLLHVISEHSDMDIKDELWEAASKPYELLLDWLTSGQRNDQDIIDFIKYMDDNSKKFISIYNKDVQGKEIIPDLIKFHDHLKRPGVHMDAEKYLYDFLKNFKDVFGGPKPVEDIPVKDGVTCQECGEFYPYAPYKPNFTCKRCRQLRDAWSSTKERNIRKLARQRGFEVLMAKLASPPTDPTEHYIENCKKCGAVISQCKCLGPHTQRWGICEECAGTKKPEKALIFHSVNKPR